MLSIKNQKNLVLIIASTGVFFEALDIAIVNLAMPLVQQYFHLANDEVQWVQTLYILLYGAFLLVGGKLADTIGRRKTFVIGNVLFLLTSLSAAIAVNFEMLVISRAIQGIAAALMMPSALSIITNTFTNPSERGRAIGIFGAFAAVGSASGMSVGGLIATYFGWQSIFLINIPVIATTLVLTFLYIPKNDSQGVSLSNLFKSFVLLSLFRIPDAMLGATVMMLLGAFFTGFLFLISMLLQNNMQYSAAFAGMLLFPFSLLSALTSKVALPYLMRKMLVHQAAILGMMLMVVGALLIVASMSWNYNLTLLLISFACVSGVGMAICFTTLTVLSVQKVPAQHHGVMSGLCTTLYFLGGGIGLTLLSSVMEEGQGNNISQLPVVVLMMFAVVAVGVLLYFGGRNLSDSKNNSAGQGSESLSQPVNQEAA
ncbi:MAG TPA: MFS transporter [Cyclobacteriaceae bacterium]|nr:MFS transporter [Cyclobacteriaceae bacterium]